MRPLAVRCIDIRNAKSRAAWSLKYFGGVYVVDFRTATETTEFLTWYLPGMRKARAFLFNNRNTYDGGDDGVTYTVVVGELPKPTSHTELVSGGSGSSNTSVVKAESSVPSTRTGKDIDKLPRAGQIPVPANSNPEPADKSSNVVKLRGRK